VSGLPRSGHIPSAIHVAWNGFLNKDATVKDLSVMKEILEAKGVRSGQDVICYCTGVFDRVGSISSLSWLGIRRSATIQDRGENGAGTSRALPKKIFMRFRKSSGLTQPPNLLVDSLRGTV